MRTLARIALISGAVALAGCDAGETTNPNDLPPLTEADKALIKQEDARVFEEENRVEVRKPKGKQARGKGVGTRR